jgi:hypothetical protein
MESMDLDKGGQSHDVAKSCLGGKATFLSISTVKKEMKEHKALSLLQDLRKLLPEEIVV